MSLQEPPISEDAFEILSFLSGMGLWLILAVVLIVFVLYKKYKK